MGKKHQSKMRSKAYNQGQELLIYFHHEGLTYFYILFLDHLGAGLSITFRANSSQGLYPIEDLYLDLCHLIDRIISLYLYISYYKIKMS